MEIRYKKRLQQRQLPSRRLYHCIRHFHLSKNQNTKCFRFSWYRQNNLPKAKRSLSSIKQCYGLSSKEIKFSSPSKRAHKELSFSKANQSVRFTPIARSRQSDCLSILSPTKGDDMVDSPCCRFRRWRSVYGKPSVETEVGLAHLHSPLCSAFPPWKPASRFCDFAIRYALP